MIALITPTGARPDQIKLCAHFMQRQDYSGEVLWIITDDCSPSTTEFIGPDFRQGWVIKKLHPKPYWKEGQNTQGRNMSVAINECKKHILEAIFIIEDDDYYKPEYIRKTLEKLKGYDITGEKQTIYYNVTIQRWIENGNDIWSSLFQTAFTPKIIPVIETLYTEKFIDFVLFRKVDCVNLFKENLSIGIKGQPGRSGIGAGHGWIQHMHPDPDGSMLQELIGEDYKLYLK